MVRFDAVWRYHGALLSTAMARATEQGHWLTIVCLDDLFGDRVTGCRRCRRRMVAAERRVFWNDLNERCLIDEWEEDTR
jgi:hypothetical protein